MISVLSHTDSVTIPLLRTSHSYTDGEVVRLWVDGVVTDTVIPKQTAHDHDGTTVHSCTLWNRTQQH